MRYILPVMLAASCLAGCTASGPAFQEAAGANDRATIYVYRLPSLVFSARDARFSVNGKRVCKLSPDGYSYFYLKPGQYEVKEEWPIDVAFGRTVRVPLSVKGNEPHYFRFETDSAFGGPGIEFHWRIEEVSPETGRSEILSKHLQDPENVNPLP